MPVHRVRSLTAMSLLRQLSRKRQFVCQQCIRRQHTIARAEEQAKKSWSAEYATPEQRAASWAEQADSIRSGAQQSVLSVLEERGLVKDVAGGRDALNWLLTEKRIGAYVGVDPTAPSLHVGHLLPLMALYWLYIHGYNTVSLLGAGTVQIGDPSGRTTARSRMARDVQRMNEQCINSQLSGLWTRVKCLGIKHQYPHHVSRRKHRLNNKTWLEKLNAVDFMRDIGSGMRLGAMLARDSVKVRMETGEGMAISEFTYPLFQAYDWWSMYNTHNVQLQIGGSDQYGNICAGMDTVSHMRKIQALNDSTQLPQQDTTEAALTAPYGITTPLLTTASGEKFGKSAGNAVWLDPQMMSSFDLYQYFLRTADDDVERYLKLFTFLPMEQINILMGAQRRDESKRLAQHVLAKELVELVHGAQEAGKAEMKHKDAFGQGTNTFSLGALRSALEDAEEKEKEKKGEEGKEVQVTKQEQELLEYKMSFITPPSSSNTTTTTTNPPPPSTQITTLPLSLLKPSSFPTLLHLSGLCTSRSEAHRLIASKGAYIILPNSGTPQNPGGLKWIPIENTPGADPRHFLVDYRALVLRVGKSRVRIVRVVRDGEGRQGE